jgi:hypothetical protein
VYARDWRGEPHPLRSQDALHTVAGSAEPALAEQGSIDARREALRNDVRVDLLESSPLLPRLKLSSQ